MLSRVTATKTGFDASSAKKNGPIYGHDIPSDNAHKAKARTFPQFNAFFTKERALHGLFTRKADPWRKISVKSGQAQPRGLPQDRTHSTHVPFPLR